MCLYLNTCILLLRYANLQIHCKQYAKRVNELILVRLNVLLMEIHM